MSQIERTTLTRIWTTKRSKLERQTNFADGMDDPHTNLEHKTSKTRTPDRFHRSNGRPSHEFGARNLQNSNERHLWRIKRTDLTRILNIKRRKLEPQTNFTHRIDDSHVIWRRKRPTIRPRILPSKTRISARRNAFRQPI